MPDMKLVSSFAFALSLARTPLSFKPNVYFWYICIRMELISINWASIAPRVDWIGHFMRVLWIQIELKLTAPIFQLVWEIIKLNGRGSSRSCSETLFSAPPARAHTVRFSWKCLRLDIINTSSTSHQHMPISIDCVDTFVATMWWHHFKIFYTHTNVPMNKFAHGDVCLIWSTATWNRNQPKSGSDI